MKHWWLKDGFVYGLSAALSRFMGVFLLPIYTRFLSTAEFGLLDLATSLSAVLLILAETQMVSGFMRSYYEAKKKKAVSSLTGSILVYYCFSNIAVISTVWMGRGLLHKYLPEFQLDALIPILIGLLPAQIVNLCLVFLRMERRPKLYLLISVGQIGLAAVLGVLFVTIYNGGTLGVLYGFAAARTLFGLIALVMIVKMFGIRFDVRYIGEIWRFGAPIVPARIATWARSYVNRLFIVGMLSMSLLGIFSVASKVAGISLLLIVSVRMVWQPFANEQYSKRGSETLFARVLNIYIFSLLVFLVMLTTASPVILRLLAPPAYWGAEPYISLLAISFLWDGAVMFFSVGNNWERKTYFNSYGAIVASLLNLALLFWGTARFGLPLVVLSAFLSAITKSVLILLTSQQVHYIPYSKKMIIVGIGVSGIYALLPYCLLVYFNWSVLQCMAIYSVVGAAAMFVMWRFILGVDDKLWLMDLLKVKEV